MKDKMLKYSVVIPVYNVAADLPACLESVLAQKDAPDYEVILVDDGATDGSGTICDDYAARFGNIRVLHTENRGVSSARNLGTEMATGEYILYLDGDDLWDQDLLAVLNRMAESNPDVMVFGYHALTGEGTRLPGTVYPVIPAGESGRTYLRALFDRQAIPPTAVWSYAIRRTLLEKNRITFREDMKVSEDFDLVMRVLTAAGSVRGTAAQCYCYRQRAGSATSNLSEKKLMDNLTCKADYFRRYPVAALANLYADNALLVAALPKEDAAEALLFLNQNRDIWNSVSQKPLKLGRMLVRLFGDYNGARIYTWIRGALRRA